MKVEHDPIENKLVIESETTVSFKVEVTCTFHDPITGYPIHKDGMGHAIWILAECHNIDEIHNRVLTELEITKVKLWKKGENYDWMMLYQYAPTEEDIAKRVTERKLAAEKLGAWRAGARPGEAASLATILDAKPVCQECAREQLTEGVVGSHVATVACVFCARERPCAFVPAAAMPRSSRATAA